MDIFYRKDQMYIAPRPWQLTQSLLVLRSCVCSQYQRQNHPNIRSYSQTISGTPSNVDLYSVLRITPNASQKQIKAAYYKQSLVWHPDRNKDSENAHQKFTQLTEAYKILGDAPARKEYDRRLKVEAHYRGQTPFHKDAVQQHQASTGVRESSRQFDTWTRSHYQEALQKRDDRVKKDFLRQNVTREESKQQSLKFLTIFAIFCVAFAWGLISKKGK